LTKQIHVDDHKKKDQELQTRFVRVFFCSSTRLIITSTAWELIFETNLKIFPKILLRYVLSLSYNIDLRSAKIIIL